MQKTNKTKQPPLQPLTLQSKNLNIPVSGAKINYNVTNKHLHVYAIGKTHKKKQNITLAMMILTKLQTESQP